jgi:REP element-mobilizing transposase RayT
MRATIEMKPRRRSRAKPGTQLGLPLKKRIGHGGERKNAGRKSRTGISPVARVRRPVLEENQPVHVNWRVLPHVWNLRSRRGFRVILRAFAASAAKQLGTRITLFAVMSNHVHVIAEADSTSALTRGMQSLAIRLAKGLNKLMGRHGDVFADRYHVHALGSPTEIRNAVDYVLNNARIHAQRQGRALPPGDDEYTVGPKQLIDPRALWRRLTDAGPPVVEPTNWLLQDGWRLARPARRATALRTHCRPSRGIGDACP